MLALAGMLLVFAAVFGGYLLERGNPWVLLQPAELLIIGGSGVGIVLVSNPPSVIRKMLRGVAATIRAPGPDRKAFLRHLRMLYEVFVYSQRAHGMAALESSRGRARQELDFCATTRTSWRMLRCATSSATPCGCS